MAYLDTNSRTTKPTSNEQMHNAGRMPSLFGVFVGYIKRADDVQRNGRLQVWIPEFGSLPDDEAGWITVNYCSPFAGATNVDASDQNNFQTFKGTQTSYGMWMIPPDINNQVLVMFVSGDMARGIWIGSLYNQFMNNMVPAMASDAKNYQHPGKPIPVAEYNKWDENITQPDRAIKPVEETKFKGVGNQGLLVDGIRGVTNTSARREAPSSVFGILTPGPVIDESVHPAKYKRKGGSSLIMDDGKCNEYIEFATKSGSKIRLDETNGLVYLINRDGTAWVQLDAEGNVDIFSAKNISLRAQRDFNIRADRNVNIEAGQNIFLKAAKDTKEEKTEFTYDVNNHPVKKEIPFWKYYGEGKGDGGNIAIQAMNNTHSTSQKNTFMTVVENNMEVRVNTSYRLTTVTGGQDIQSKSGIKITTDSALDIGAKGNMRVGSNGEISVTADGNLILCTNSTLSQSSVGNMVITSGSNMFLDSAQLNIPTKILANDLEINTIKASRTDTGVINSTTVAIDGRRIGNGSPVTPTAAKDSSPISPQTPVSAPPARPADVKPLNEKLNILATWQDPASKFKRNSESQLTTVSRFPTYEPCPEHETFIRTSVEDYKPAITQADKTYEGSGSAGNSPTTQPPAATVPGANNTEIPQDPVENNTVASDFNTAAFICQIKKHEGYKNVSYKDTENLLTGGVGHLLRKDELLKYPLGTPIPADQIDKWLEQDTVTALKIAQNLCGPVWSELSDVRKRAVVDLAYNLGQPRLSKFTNFLKAMNSKNFDQAAQELKNSKWYTQVGRRGPNIVTMIAQSVDPLRCG